MLHKDKLEAFVVYKTMEFLQKDDVIQQLSEALYNLQFTESTMLPKLEEQLKDKNQEMKNIVNAVQKGFATQTLLQRLGELEKERDEIGEAIAKEKIKTPIFSQDHFRMALHNFRKIDISKQDGKRKIIDTFINAIYVSNDDFKIVYNVNGKEETIKLEELESSTLFSNGAPKTGKFKRFCLNLPVFCISRPFYFQKMGRRWGATARTVIILRYSLL